jgi:UDP-glucose 4-epimerase
MHFFVTGGAGFIGSALVDRLLQLGCRVTAYDDFSTGHESFLCQAKSARLFNLVSGDILDADALAAAMHGADIVVHLSANADVRFGIDHPKKDLEQNTVGTFSVLEAMRKNGIKRIAFSSTGSVYGEAEVVPTPETAPFPIQTSLYGASKIAGEGLIAAYCEGFGMQSWIFRFVSILGERYTHGHIFDFYKSLQRDPTRLEVLGNGLQRKSYLYVQDCIDAILLALERATEKVNIFNLGTDESCVVNDSIGWICQRMNVAPKIEYSGGVRGWVGDNPLIVLDTRKIQALGWQPKLSIQDGVIRTVDFLHANGWVIDGRKGP